MAHSWLSRLFLKNLYTLDLPNEPNHFPTFHASLLQKFIPNNDQLFSSHTLSQPGPVIMNNGKEEWFIDCILDKWARGKGKQYLVHWHGWGAEEDRWLPGHEFMDTEAPEHWLNDLKPR